LTSFSQNLPKDEEMRREDSPEYEDVDKLLHWNYGMIRNSQDRNNNMLIATRKKDSTIALIPMIFFMLLLPVTGVHSEAEAMLSAGATLVSVDLGPQAEITEEKNPDLRDVEGEERKIFSEPLLYHSPEKKMLQWKSGPNLRLKTPGLLPGIEFGVEMHSFQALQSVVPSENLPKGVDLKQQQPLLLPPSVNSPDYNGGFLRFTW
jgi:hypothetical protein